MTLFIGFSCRQSFVVRHIIFQLSLKGDESLLQQERCMLSVSDPAEQVFILNSAFTVWPFVLGEIASF